MSLTPGKNIMYIISYDISKDKKRRKISKELENYGKRVQYSVFECELDKKRFEELYLKLVHQMGTEETEDSIRIYSLCKNCVEKTAVIGVKTGKDDLDSQLEEIFVV